MRSSNNAIKTQHQQLSEVFDPQIQNVAVLAACANPFSCKHPTNVLCLLAPPPRLSPPSPHRKAPKADLITEQQHDMRKQKHQQKHTAVTDLWLCWLLITLSAVAAGSSPCHSGSVAVVPRQCQQLPRVCLDHGVYVLYANQHNPQHEHFTGLPALSLRNISFNYHGFGDAWGTAFPYPSPLVRPATAGEESPQLAHPQFSTCTYPLVIVAHRLYSFGAFFVNTVGQLYMWQLSGALDRR